MFHLQLSFFTMRMTVASILFLMMIAEVVSMEVSNSTHEQQLNLTLVEEQMIFNATDNPKESSVKCPEGFVYSTCTSLCPPKNCATLHLRPFCFSLRCGPPKCVCKPGLVLKAYNVEKCVAPEDC
ncbi:hypothetical protein Tcan_08188 [Toxocara canis]|uniref:TIL domain-containing protein n=1 Tax=Toxocara canis TaxID=6265 RepID=A0A0B2VRT0_TOXCA|nr:hypothetical protein Tcan_08188 [Toxocara canis]